MSSHGAAVRGLAGLSVLAALALVACDGGGGGGNGADGGTDGVADSGAEAGGGADAGEAMGAQKGPKDLRWQTLAPVPQARFYVGVGAARQKVFVVGGFQDNEATLVHTYDTKTNAWAPVKALPSLYKLANVATVGDRLFVLGGLSNPQTVEYDFANDAWILRATMPAPQGRGGAAVGVWGNTVLLAGGVLRGQSANLLNTGMRMAEVYAYDSAKDTWQTLAEMPVENGYAMGAVLDDLFWIIGGSTNLARTDEVLVLNLVTKAWMVAPRLPVSLSSAAVGILNGNVILTGGIASGTGTISRDTLVLDPATGQWSTIAPLPTARFATGGAVVGNRLYVPTGIAADSSGAMFNPVDKMEALGL